MSINTADTVGHGERTMTWAHRAQFAGLASVGAGAIHLAAAGIHSEHPTLARIFVIMGAVQVITGLVLALDGGRPAAAAVGAVNIAAVGGWVLTRGADISWVSGLEESESPQFADTACAALGAAAVVLAIFILVRGARHAPHVGLVAPGALVGAISVAAMLTGATHVHSHDEAAHVHDETTAGASAAAASGSATHVHDETTAGASAAAASRSATHVHDETAGTAATPAAPPAASTQVHAVDTTWPRPFDPTQPIDLSGVPGVTPEQQDRAEALVASTLQDLPQFADVNSIGSLGFTSIGDAGTGFEHYLNLAYIRDDSFLDPNRPESLVYEVHGDRRTLVSAMFMAKDMDLTDPELLDFGGPLMQWHVHLNLCWGLDANKKPVVLGVTDAAGNCPPGSINTGGTVPMIHVWTNDNQCGPFAALEGVGAGQVAGDAPRVDQCTAHDHGAGGG